MRWLFRIPPLVAASLFVAAGARAQTPYDPATATRPQPNVMLLLDANRSTSINGETCRGLCHVESNCGGFGGEWDCNIYRNGETRLQLARRVLTGGYGWNTDWVAPHGPADARTRLDGVMDAYKVRWGVSFYDGLSTRLVVDPSENNEAAQKAVIDFGQTPTDWVGPAGIPAAGPNALHSFIEYPRSTQCCGNYAWPPPWDRNFQHRLPWFAEAADARARQARALLWLRDYWDPAVDASRWMPVALGSATQPMFFSPGIEPEDNTVINSDLANVLVTAGAGGCRRNYTIMMTDGHGGDPFGGVGNGEAAGQIYDLPGPGGIPLPEDKRSKVFAIHFGVIDKPNADRIADYGYDGTVTTTQAAFSGAPGGAITDLTAMLSAFSAIFNVILPGDYVGAAPTATRLGDRLAKTFFTVRDCASAAWNSCNVGRPGHVEWYLIQPDGSVGARQFDMGTILRSRDPLDRDVWSTRESLDPTAATETNCGLFATCGDTAARLHEIHNDHGWEQVPADVPGGPVMIGSLADFLRGDMNAMFANEVLRGDTDGDGVADDPYKLMDIANSRPIVVGAPPGIGEDLARWHAFRDMTIPRYAGAGNDNVPNGDGTDTTVKRRDQVLYVGGNDGFLHAFLVGKAKSIVSLKGVEVEYEGIGTACTTGGGIAQFSHSFCEGMELFAYSPRFLQKNWGATRGGHFYMADGTPVVEDVLFTKNTAVPGPVCASPGCAGWEFRTVLVSGVGAGGRGYFALDVTNPFDPQLLWEREFTSVSGRGTSTSIPVIARVKRVVAGTPIPYYVALMGGGANEATGAGPKGTFLAVGLEDGQTFTTTAADAAEADFAGSPSCFDHDNDGFTDTCYAATTRASIYKIRLDAGDPSSMTMVKFFDGRHANAANNPAIRTFTRLIATSGTDNRINLFYTTGNIDKPQDASEQNYLFKIRDLDASSMAAWTPALNAARQAAACSSIPAAFTGVTDGTLALAPGEKVLFDPVLVGGSVLFTSFAPNANPCLDGEGFLYGIRYDTCDVGLDTGDADSLPDEDKVALGLGVPSQVAANYAKGDVYVANSDNTFAATGGGKAPQPSAYRLLKLWWREVL